MEIRQLQCFERVADTAAITFSEAAEFLVAGVLAFGDAASARAFVALERRLAEARPRPPGAAPISWVEDPAGQHGYVAAHRASGAAPVGGIPMSGFDLTCSSDVRGANRSDRFLDAPCRANQAKSYAKRHATAADRTSPDQEPP